MRRAVSRSMSHIGESESLQAYFEKALAVEAGLILAGPDLPSL